MTKRLIAKLFVAAALALLLAAAILGVPAVDFDPGFYLRVNPDVAADPVYSKDPLKHYLEIGRSEGRRPSALAPRCYADGRPAATMRMDAQGAEPIIRHGDGPNRCDYLGARESIAFQVGDTYYLHYDGAGPRGWLACLATSKDLHHWDLKGPVLDLGAKGEDDSGTASSPWTIFDGKLWHMFYVGTPFTTPPPDRIPAVPYYTLTATAPSPSGPWTKKVGFQPFRTQPGTYYADTASPGQIIKYGGEYLMFFSAAAGSPLKRTLGIARTRDLDGHWTVDRDPVFPPDEQVENSALYFEPTNQYWFVFTNHIGLDRKGEYTESTWVFWSKDPNHWDTANKAVVLDELNCHWNVRTIGMPSVVKVKDRLALFYDAPAKDTGDMGRDVGLAWLKLPLVPPMVRTAAISNVHPRRDLHGEILDAHDGVLEYFEGEYYLYGTRYGSTDGLKTTNRYVCYSSSDLTNWTPHGEILKDAPPRMYFRPYVKFNAKTRKYVLWYNVGIENKDGVATADRPQGPFTIQNPDVHLKHSDLGIGDHGLFVDDDGTGYIVYTAPNLAKMTPTEPKEIVNHRVSIEKLTPDYLGSTGESSGFIAGNCESPSMFKRNGTYYLLTDNTCAFCAAGSGARVYTATSPLGPYTYRGNINVEGTTTDVASPWTQPGTGRANAIIKAQQTHIAILPGINGPAYIWMGDRWNSTPDKIKGHDFQYWSSPLKFDASGMIEQLQFQDYWTLQLPVQRVK
jgi:predicted GH43/DUF377 family glycosyl hydrolase